MCVLTPTDFYTVVLHPSLVQMTLDADEMMKRGWKPVGGPIVTPSGKFSQAFYKEYTEPEKAPAKKGTKK